MTDPQVFYNREDLWTVASEVGMDESGQQKTLAIEPNFVLMKLPGETNAEFVEILPFTPANRNIQDRKSTRLNSSHSQISYAVFCLKKKNNNVIPPISPTSTCPRRLFLVEPRFPLYYSRLPHLRSKYSYTSVLSVASDDGATRY